MNLPPVCNPVLPYVGYIEGGFPPGRMVRIHGFVPPVANRFAINLQCGPNTMPRDDIALHLNPRFPENQMVRNSLQCQSWGPEETYGHMPLARGQPFEILLLCEPQAFKIAINGQHYTDYPHRLPYQRVTYLAIDGDVTISQISYEGGTGCHPVAPPVAPPPYCPYPPGPTGPAPYPPSAGVYPPPPHYVPGCPPPPPGYPGHGGHHGGHHGVGMAGTAVGAGLAGAALTGHLSPKKAAKKQKKMAKRALKYGLPVAGVGLGAYALHKGFHHHHHHSSSSSSSSSSEEE